MSEPRASEPWTIRRVVRWSAEDFAQRGLASPRLDAELLVAHALGLTRVKLYMELERPLSAEELSKVRELVQRRRRREPVAYLLGAKEFWGRSFVVSPAVLVPRPDTETLVERALALIPGGTRREASPPSAPGDVVSAQREARGGQETHVEPVIEDVEAPIEAPTGMPSESESLVAGAPGVRDVASSGAPQAHGAPYRVLDLCTGTGCIGLTLACERPAIEVVLTDLSPAALAVARRNLEALASKHAGLEARVEILEGDLFAPLPPGRRFDLITCNPPYLSESELREVDADVRDHEPESALVAGPAGDEVLVRLAREVGRWLAPGGTVLVEVGPSQGARCRHLLEEAGLRDVRVLRDLADRDRVVEARAA
jgi:release factor glutamine methyltransferase